MNKLDYIAELEKALIFMCDVYTKGADSLACQTNDKGEVDDKWWGIFVAFPTIQGTQNRIFVERIGALRTRLGNREAPSMSFEELYEKMKIGREAPPTIKSLTVDKEQE